MPRKPVRQALGASLRAVGEAGAPGIDLDQCMAAVAGKGDRAAFGRIVQHFAPRLVGFFTQGRASRSEADELALETLTWLWRDAALYDSRRSTLAAFVFVIARNLRVERAAGAELATAESSDGEADFGDAALVEAAARLRLALEGDA
jgi:RNA polymerase sigma-70 factor (ECF subfamily)